MHFTRALAPLVCIAVVPLFAPTTVRHVCHSLRNPPGFHPPSSPLVLHSISRLISHQSRAPLSCRHPHSPSPTVYSLFSFFPLSFFFSFSFFLFLLFSLLFFFSILIWRVSFIDSLFFIIILILLLFFLVCGFCSLFWVISFF